MDRVPNGRHKASQGLVVLSDSDSDSEGNSTFSSHITFSVILELMKRSSILLLQLFMIELLTLWACLAKHVCFSLAQHLLHTYMKRGL